MAYYFKPAALSGPTTPQEERHQPREKRHRCLGNPADRAPQAPDREGLGAIEPPPLPGLDRDRQGGFGEGPDGRR